MAVKRMGSKKDPKTMKCLRCGRLPEGIKPKDGTIHTCAVCGQQHFVDIIGDRLTLTVVERPDLRKTPQKTEAEKRIEALEQENEELKQQLQEALRNACEWEAAAEGLARMIEEMKVKEHESND